MLALLNMHNITLSVDLTIHLTPEQVYNYIFYPSADIGHHTNN